MDEVIKREAGLDTNCKPSSKADCIQTEKNIGMVANKDNSKKSGEIKNVTHQKKNKDSLNKIGKVLLWCAAIVIAFAILGSLCMTVGFAASVRDLWLYRLSGGIMLLFWEIGILLELNVLNLKEKMPLIKTNLVIKHVFFGTIMLVISVSAFLILQGLISEDFKSKLSSNDYENMESGEVVVTSESAVISPEEDSEDILTTKNDEEITWKELAEDRERYPEVLMLLGIYFPEGKYTEQLNSELVSSVERELVANLFEYYSEYAELPADFTATFTEFCVGEEYEDMIIEGEDNPFYEAVSNGFQISWKSDGTYYIDVKPEEAEAADGSLEIVNDENPLVFTIDSNDYTVGNCSFSVEQVQVASFPFKVGSRFVYIRIYGTVKNNSNEETYFSATRLHSNVVGTYYGEEEDRIIGGNSNCKWENDTKQEQFSTGYTLAPGEERELKIQAVYTTTIYPTYDYKLDMDVYFSNNDNLFTLTLN